MNFLKLKSRLSKLAVITGLVLVSFYITTGFVWSFLNIAHVPKYGDTIEYWQLSKTLNIDSWRTIGYPVVLRLVSLIPEDIILIRITLYIVQASLCFVAFYYLFNNLLDIYYRQQLDRSFKQKICLISAMILTLSPVVAHMNLAVLSDSLANSFFIIFAAALLKFLTGKDLTKMDSILFVSSIPLMGIMRQDRIFVALACIFSSLMWFMIRKKGKKALLVIALIGVLLTIGLNNVLQKPNPNRPRMSWQFTLFDRVVRGRLTKSMPYMPSVIQARVGSVSENWDRGQSNWVGVARALDDSEGKNAMLSASIVTIKKYPLEIIQDITSDFVEYLVAPLTYMYETSIGNSTGVSPSWTTWTNSRMGMYHNKLTRLYLCLHFIVLSIASLVIVVLFFYYKTEVNKDMSIIVGGVLLVTVFTSLAHTLQSSLGFHIRYALPIYSLQLALVVFILIVLFLPRRVESKVKTRQNSLSRSRIQI